MTEVGDHQRKSIYDHPSSQKHRADRAVEHRGTAGDPISQLRQAHRAAVVDLGQKHRGELLALDAQHQRLRQDDPMIAKGKAPDASWLEREKRQRWKVEAKHKDDRPKLADRHKNEMATAIRQHGAHVR